MDMDGFMDRPDAKGILLSCIKAIQDNMMELQLLIRSGMITMIDLKSFLIY